MLAVGSGYPLLLTYQPACLSSNDICLSCCTCDSQGSVVLPAQPDTVCTAALDSISNHTSAGRSSLQSDSGISLRGLQAQQVLLPCDGLFIFRGHSELFAINRLVVNIITGSVGSDSCGTVSNCLERLAILRHCNDFCVRGGISHFGFLVICGGDLRTGEIVAGIQRKVGCSQIGVPMDCLTTPGGRTGNSNGLGIRTVGDGDSAAMRTYLLVTVISHGNCLRTVFCLPAERSRTNGEEVRVVASNRKSIYITPLNVKTLLLLTGTNGTRTEIQRSDFLVIYYRIIHIRLVRYLDTSKCSSIVTAIAKFEVLGRFGKINRRGCISLCGHRNRGRCRSDSRPYGRPSLIIRTLGNIPIRISSNRTATFVRKCQLIRNTVLCQRDYHILVLPITRFLNSKQTR